MQEKKINITELFDRIKDYYHLKTDKELAEFIGIKPSGISQARSSNLADLHKIVIKCKDMNLNYLFFGYESKSEEGENKLSSTDIKSKDEHWHDPEAIIDKLEIKLDSMIDGKMVEYKKRLDQLDTVLKYLINK